VDVFQKQCFAVFCGVLWCFAVFCVRVFLAFFTKQHKTDQKVYKTHKTNKIRFVCAIQRNTVLCSFLSLRKCLQKHSQNTSKTLQNIRKTPQNTVSVFQKPLAEHHKTPAKHPQNTAKHRKTQNTTKHKTHFC